MKIDTIGVQAFIAIAESGSFQTAAESLFLSQAGITRRLQNLEEYLGVKLIERTTRSVALTRVGEDFLPHAKRLLSELASSLSEIRDTGKLKRGSVTIACVPTVGVRFLPKIIQAYSAKYPDNHIKILDHTSAGVSSAVLQREAEFGITIAGSHHAELSSVPLLEDDFVLICRDDHPLSDKAQLSWKELEPYPLISIGQFSGNRPLLDRALETQNLALQSVYEVQRVSTALGLVAEGVGAAVLPRLALQSDAYPRIRVLSLVEPVVARGLVLIARKTAEFSPAAGALYDMVQQYHGELLAH
ncbi:LysR family transcriptional regulator [Pseudogulbenkiania sp. MAI-1]|uniref:LysR family transcriptional regulator n=1 Tax=Pseudogulbenkiania sp. MAI-1 TaxID=990370 RepID=UPI00045E7847|nr:LysR family transcriptional regulator [Pseudogulbenkiania sp. MAI-1]